MKRIIFWPLETYDRVTSLMGLIGAVGVVFAVLDRAWPWWFVIFWLFPMALVMWTWVGVWFLSRIRPRPDWTLNKLIDYLNTRHLKRYRPGSDDSKSAEAIQESRNLWKMLEQAICDGDLTVWIRSSKAAPLFPLEQKIFRNYQFDRGHIEEEINFCFERILPKKDYDFIKSTSGALVTKLSPRADCSTAEPIIGMDPHFSSLQVCWLWPPRDWWKLWRKV